jgi:circadian clock protein KaiB
MKKSSAIYRIRSGSWSASTSDPQRPQKVMYASTEAKNKEYVLRLYVAGTTSKSMRAVANIKEICESSLKNRYDLEVIDIYQQPVLMKGEQIIAAPTLVKKLPLPLRSLLAICLIPNGYL